VAKGFSNLIFLTFSGVSSMKRFTYTTALKAVLVGVVISGMATACQNGESTIGGFLPKEEQATAGAKTDGAATQSDEERKAEQARKIAEFLAKPEVKEMSAGLEEIAQAVAVAVEDKALTDRIYEKCMEKFDGETNTLWMHLEADSKVKSQGGWNKRVDAELSKGPKNATVKGIGNIEVAVKKFEKTIGAPLHLFWMYPSAWDRKTTPLVAFVPFDANPKTRTSIPAFDAKGNRYELGKDGAVAKQRPMIVVAVNERTQQNGTLQSGIFIGQNHETQSASGTQYLEVVNQLKKSKNSKPGSVTQNWFIPAGFTPYTISITNIGFENEAAWGGTYEYFYSVTSGNHPFGWTLQTKYLGIGPVFYNSTINPGGPNNSNTLPLPTYYYGSTTTAFVHYWEADFPHFDDLLTTHEVPKVNQASGSTQWVVIDNSAAAGYQYQQ
jgi:hypothetical protein